MSNDIPVYNEKLGLALRHDQYSIIQAAEVAYNQALDDCIEQVIDPLEAENARIKRAIDRAGFEDRGGEEIAPPVNKDPYAPKFFKLEKEHEEFIAFLLKNNGLPWFEENMYKFDFRKETV